MNYGKYLVIIPGLGYIQTVVGLGISEPSTVVGYRKKLFHTHHHGFLGLKELVWV